MLKNTVKIKFFSIFFTWEFVWTKCDRNNRVQQIENIIIILINTSSGSILTRHTNPFQTTAGDENNDLEYRTNLTIPDQSFYILTRINLQDGTAIERQENN